MRASFLVLSWIAGLMPLATCWAARPEQIQLEVAQEERGPIDGATRWLAELQRLEFASLRIRAARPDEQPQLTSVGSTAGPKFRIVAVLTSRNELRLPQVSFRLGDRERLQKWVAELAVTDDAQVAAKRHPFGLTPQQALELQRHLSPPVTQVTHGVALSEFLHGTCRQVDLPVRISPQVQSRLNRAAPIVDDLQGLATGTALAAALRPAGLGLVPSHTATGAPEMTVVVAADSPAVWPVGQVAQQRPQAVLPKLFESVPVEIVDTPLSQVLTALQPRLNVPLVIDHAGLAARKIQLDQVKVSHPASKTHYQRVLQRLLFKARLEMELRVDERERPFLWVTPIVSKL